jgi:phosphoribosylformimino-5-aminoimidazole carboxamide ribotide isomerase
MLIWPAIDLLDGKCVRLKQGDYQRATEYGADPAVVARQWVDQGAERLHLVDLDAARNGSPRNRAALEAILSAVKVPCQVGGGVRDGQSIAELLAMGMHRLIVGTAALKRPAWFAQMCDTYPGQLCVGIDARDGWVATDGWLQVSQTRAVDLAQDLRTRTANIAGLIYTDISRDGMLSGPNIEQLAEIEQATDIPVIASGGVANADDVARLARRGTHACIIGRALYEGTLRLADAIRASRS